MTDRVYLDWNATAPLRAEARAAMLAAMDAVGNPSSAHREGRAARAIVETARAQVAALAGCDPEAVVFTSGATEANAAALSGVDAVVVSPCAHPSLLEAARRAGDCALAEIGPHGRVSAAPGEAVLAIGAAEGETGLLESPDVLVGRAAAHCDATQIVGRAPWRFDRSGATTAALSAHKIGGPKGVGALLTDGRRDPASLALIGGGGQEGGHRSGTENVIGIAGFGAAAEAALRECDAGVWARVETLRNILESRISERAPRTIFIGREAERLPNTSCFATPGWRAETQVMALDLAGFAVSAGSACSSGKVRASHVLRAMGFDDDVAGAAIRVSLGPATTEDEILRFCDAWAGLHERRRAKAA